jgi:hypothetical protein
VSAQRAALAQTCPLCHGEVRWSITIDARGRPCFAAMPIDWLRHRRCAQLSRAVRRQMLEYSHFVDRLVMDGAA